MKRADRLIEVEESDEVVSEKCKDLAGLIKKSKCTIVYTGAGISTAASIPDYRGSNGVWTLAEKGIAALKCIDPVASGPTGSHMVLKEMCRKGIARHILSQNCDGLHLRSGLPQKMLSEIHGNMHIEVCLHCNPSRQYMRPYDVTEKSQYRRHATGRYCSVCNHELVDTIVHFGEAGKVAWPLNWNGVIQLIDQCDLIVCVGTSLAVLKEYHFLWPKPKTGTKIAIVNLQWTPKDRLSCLKINAKCDVVMEKLAGELGIPITCYCRNCDPILNPRRSARTWELMERLTDCTCRNRIPASVVDESRSARIPGWWAFEIQKTLKRSAQGVPRANASSRKRPSLDPPLCTLVVKRESRVSQSAEPESALLPPDNVVPLCESFTDNDVVSHGNRSLSISNEEIVDHEMDGISNLLNESEQRIVESVDSEEISNILRDLLSLI